MAKSHEKAQDRGAGPARNIVHRQVGLDEGRPNR